MNSLRFDVGIERYTTVSGESNQKITLRFDVGIERYTTYLRFLQGHRMLRFDVGIERYTTQQTKEPHPHRCGLM